MKFLKIILPFLFSKNLTKLNKKIIWFSFIGSFLSFFAITISDGIMNKLGKIDYYEIFLFSNNQNILLQQDQDQDQEKNYNQELSQENEKIKNILSLKKHFLNELNKQNQNFDFKLIYFSPSLIENSIYEVQGLNLKEGDFYYINNITLDNFEISVPRLFAYKNNLNIGDKIRLFSFDKTYTPLGKIFTNRLFTIKNIHRMAHHQRFFINEDSFQRMFKTNEENAILFNNLTEKKEFEKFTQKFLENYSNGNQLELFSHIYKKNENLQSAIEMEKFLIKLLTGFLLFISLSVLYNSTLLMKQTKQHDIFILKTIGYNNWHIDLIFVSINLIILLFSLLLGFIFAILFLEFIMPYVLIFKEYQLDMQYLFIVVIFSILITTFISVFSSKKA